jgi:predicted amidohydrolase
MLLCKHQVSKPSFEQEKEPCIMHLKTAVIQVNSRDDPAENLSNVERFLDQAADMGAQFASLPEFWTYLGPYSGFDAAAQTIPGPVIECLQEKARKYKMIVHGGSIVERHPQLAGKFYNTSVLIDRDGEIVARYRKIHLFDVNLANGEKHYESERIAPGNDLVTAEIDGITFGLTICYDLRFPELYRLLALRGAQIIMVPAGFILHTGRDHWEVLLRARAIENLCYVVAPAQVGTYPPNRQCFGRSMIVSPWGLVLAQAPDTQTVVMADIDLAQIEQARAQIPSLENRRPTAYSW